MTLTQVLRQLDLPSNENLLVGINTSDDAAVYKLNDDLALVQTVDFFTPLVDDPYVFGQIAAANALSDLYAMGATPITALNIVAFPSRTMSTEILREILRGGADKVSEAGAVLAGGHTIEDQDPKYGLAVTGLVHPNRVITNSSARSGDLLYLTKPLGVGVLATALKGGVITLEEERRLISLMTCLNRAGGQAIINAGIKCCTDITGFGLLGHLREMAAASGLDCELEIDKIKFLPGALEYARMGLIPAGMYANREYLEKWVSFEANIPFELQDLLFDPQTSGGLLIAVAPEEKDRLLKSLKEKKLELASQPIGQFIGPGEGLIKVRMI